MFLLSAGVALILLSVLVGWMVPARVRLFVWTMVIVAGVVPWSSWVGHSHWGRVQWLPFQPPLRLRDIVLNVAMYLPVGFFFVRRGHGSGRVATAVLYGLVLSLVTEATQIFSHGRFPSMTDVVTNASGALIGALAAWRVATTGSPGARDRA